MRCNRLAECGRGGAVLAAILLLTTGPSAAIHADVLTLNNGGTVVGEIVEASAEAYTLRTRVGVIRIPVDHVARITPSPTPFRVYDAKKAACPDTPAGHVELAEWCARNELDAEKAAHLKRALELDPEFEPARKLLGHAKLGDLWVDSRPASTRPDSASPESVESDRDQPPTADSIQIDWQRRISSIKSSLLDSTLPRLVKDGRKRILEIRDPLAILPLARVLSRGDLADRELLVEALAKFTDDEATLNLAVLALADANAGVRSAALIELARRADERVPPQFRKALASRDDALVRRAAVGLAKLKATVAVPELIEVLTIQKRMAVDAPVRKYFGELPKAFSGGTRVRVGQNSFDYRPQIGVTDATGLVTIQWDKRIETVTVFRTEVRQALVDLTGVDFGFDAAKWQKWYQENAP